MNTSSKRGFTLIEMAVVLLIIGILAGIVLRNIGSFGPQARDTRRISDLTMVSSYLAQYVAKNGHFPVANNWDNLQEKLREIGVANLPKDPSGGSYQYFYCNTQGVEQNRPNHFVLKATLEQSNTENPRLYETSFNSANPPDGWTCKPEDLLNCSASTKFYCLAQ